MLRLPSSLFAYVAGIACLVVRVSLWASEAANEKLPPNPYGCTVCHGAATVTPTEVPPDAILPFKELGVEWASQGAEEIRVWSELALANVDGDGCSNGFELGDPSGSWLPDSERETYLDRLNGWLAAD